MSNVVLEKVSRKFGDFAAFGAEVELRQALEPLHGLGLLSDGQELPLGLFLWLRIAHAPGASNLNGRLICTSV